jgi:hypothetical protein
VPVEREWHLRKQQRQSASTEEGMQIDESELQSEKRKSARHERIEPHSNVTTERVRHPEKQAAENRSVKEGTKMVCAIWSAGNLPG